MNQHVYTQTDGFLSFYHAIISPLFIIIVAVPMSPETNPALKELEKDIDERNKAAAEKKTKADELKEQGNAAFKKGRAVDTVDLYVFFSVNMAITRR
jgi:F0F1-type ATP synthase membrane subunit b/b'